jgi:hypothetical protein
MGLHQINTSAHQRKQLPSEETFHSMGGNLCRLLNGKRSNIQNIQRGLEFNPQIALKKKKKKGIYR